MLYSQYFFGSLGFGAAFAAAAGLATGFEGEAAFYSSAAGLAPESPFFAFHAYPSNFL